MSKHLYELTAQVKDLQKLVADGELTTQQIADTMDGLNLEVSEKANRILYMVKNIDGMTAGIDGEIKRLTARKKVFDNAKESIKSYLKINMEATGTSKIECDLFTITLKKPAKIVIIDDEDALPDDLVSTTVTIKPDKKAIAILLKDGEEVEGAHLGEGKSALIIK